MTIDRDTIVIAITNNGNQLKYTLEYFGLI